MSIRRTIIAKLFLYICSQYHLWLCGAQHVTFDFCNRNVDGLTFTGERGIVLKCCVENLKSSMIQIEHQLRTVIMMNDGEANCLEYTIGEVKVDDGGEYRCIVNYTCINGFDGSEVLTNYLNVQEKNIFPHCIRNGTRGEPYKPGDWLLMSCYCRVGDMCKWFSTVEGTGVSKSLHHELRHEHSGLETVQISVHYTTDTNSSTRYNCIYATKPPNQHQIVKTCSIGPEHESSDDDIMDTDTQWVSLKCAAPEIQTSSNVIDTSSTTKSSERVNSMTTQGNHYIGPSQNIYIIIAAGVISLILIMLVIILTITCRRRSGVKDSRVNSINRQRNDAYADDDNTIPAYYNQDVVTEHNTSSSYYNQGTNIEPSTGYAKSINNAGTRDSKSHNYDDPAGGTRVQSSVEDVDMPNDGYAEVGESMRTHRDNREISSGIKDGETPSVDPMLVNPLQTQKGKSRFGDDGKYDFSMLYAEIDKTKKREPHSTSKDFSGVYAQVNKPRESEQY